MKEIFAPFLEHFLCTFCALCLLLISSLFSLKNASFNQSIQGSSHSYIKKMQNNLESVVIVRDKKFHVERVF